VAILDSYLRIGKGDTLLSGVWPYVKGSCYYKNPVFLRLKKELNRLGDSPLALKSAENKTRQLDVMPEVIPTFEETEHEFLFPRECVFLFPPLDDVAIVDNRFFCAKKEGLAVVKKPFELRPIQSACFREWKYLFDSSTSGDWGCGGVFVAPCGEGKTLLGLEIIRDTCAKGLILVDNESAKDAWVSEARRWYGEECGLIQGPRDKWTIGNVFTVAMIPTLVSALKKHSREDLLSFFEGEKISIVISDEVDRLSANQWRKVIGCFSAFYRIGLTATPDRDDQKVFLQNIGPILFDSKKDSVVMPARVYFVNFNKPSTARSIFLWDGSVSVQKLISAVSENEERNDWLFSFVEAAVKKGRTVLCLSDRVEQVKKFAQRIEDSLDVSVAVRIGGVSEKEKKASYSARCVVGTYGACRRSYNREDFDCLIFLTPTGSPEQSVGRITRKSAGKKEPLVLDPIDTCYDIARFMAQKRRKIYKGLGYTV